MATSLFSIVSPCFKVAFFDRTKQAGFNAGDGTTYFNMPESNKDAIINITSTSNIGSPGRWMFRLESANIVAPGCDKNGKKIRINDMHLKFTT